MFSQCSSTRVCLKTPNIKSSNVVNIIQQTSQLHKRVIINAIQRIDNCEILEIKKLSGKHS